jgi:hypothetical protein
MNKDPINGFSLKYYMSIIKDALDNGYQFKTLSEYVKNGYKFHSQFMLRHDLDTRPQTLRPMLDAEREMGVKSTIFVRLAGAEYNYLSYDTYLTLKEAIDDGFEVGLHTNFVEFAKLTNGDPWIVLAEELNSIRGHFAIDGIACHRDFNYTYNSLPYVKENWKEISSHLGLTYEAYDQQIMNNTKFINETVAPIGWRDLRPEPIIKTGQSICMSTHPHWWWAKNPFEAHQ